MTEPSSRRAYNWAGNLAYAAKCLHSPESIAELADLVASAEHIRALGTRHSFNDLADATEDLVSLDRIDGGVTIDPDGRTVSLPAGMRYGVLAVRLDEAGWALANLASLPHVCVAGAIATATHGSGDHNPTLSAAVRELELLTADGTPRVFRRGDPDFAGVVVGLGALGIVSRVVLDVEPTFGVRQDVYAGLEWSTLLENFDTITGAGYSVSILLTWHTGTATVLVKSRSTDVLDDLLGAPRRTGGGHRAALTDRTGAIGAWHLRLPHFRLDHSPSRGAELQSEYLLPREHATAGLAALRSLGDRLDPALYTTEVRTIRADELWLSMAYGRDTVGIHFTWKQRPELVLPLLPRIEHLLEPYAARPHWGKLFARTDVAALYPRFADFVELRDRLDPNRKFSNAFTQRLFGP